MANKRPGSEESPVTNGVNGVKRRKTDSSHPNTDSPNSARQQPVLTADEREKLAQWLDKKANNDVDMFKITYPGGAGKGKKSPAKRPNGERLLLDGREYGEVAFAVANKQKWEQLTKYRRCTVSEQTFGIGECVFVRSDEDEKVEGDEDGSLSQWKAQLHEVRALDENHVYLRVSWLYRPFRDLPGGPRSYHGKYELIPSTEMMIIDAKTINGALKVKYWDEYKDDDVHDATEYFWRQSFDHLSSTLSSCRTICKCDQPQNPDQQIVQCSNCNDWQHARCLEQEVLEKYLADNPGQSNGAATNGAPKPKGKKGRQSKGAATPARTEVDGVSAAIKTDGDGKSNVKVVITDTRETSATEEREPPCLLCGKTLDGEGGGQVDVKQ
ncbi:putative chromatin binding protein [Elsinoe australis]|uniref:Putative chromatin binding protein n=1 Tax=Elsinoe australis TaxID=40998 RepID=A0A4U7B268_9PEZI|nr:putative chromatin binding protein [Elsinoe australis]